MHLWTLLSSSPCFSTILDFNNFCTFTKKFTLHVSKNKPNVICKFHLCWFFWEASISSTFIKQVLWGQRDEGATRGETASQSRCWEKMVFQLTCWLLLLLLLQSDSSLQLRVNAGRNDGRRELSQVGQNTFTQGAHISLSQLALCTTSTLKKRWLISQGADFYKEQE